MSNNESGIEWRDNYEFGAVMQLEYFIGRSSCNYITLEDCESDKKYSMFIPDFFKMAQTTKIDHGFIDGIWTFRQVGRNFGIKYVGEQ